jgi:hypothetical protein
MIGDEAFSYCDKLTSVIISNSVTMIGDSAFSGCSGLTSIKIPNSVTAIEGGAFRDCNRLTSVIIPNSVRTIGDSAFLGCSGLTSIFVDESNTEYSSNENILFNKDQTILIYCPDGKIGNYTIPNSVTTIGNKAFENCSGLTSVTIPHSVTTIRGHAFFDCSGLTSIIIPNSVTSIGNVFEGCINLSSIFVEKSNTKYSSKDGILFNKDQTKLLCCPAGKTGDYSIPNTVTDIENGAFYGCSGLTSVTIPNTVTYIDHFVFFECSGLTSITIGNSVTYMGDMAFGKCSALTKIYVKAKNPPSLHGCAFEDVPTSIPVYVPVGSANDYKESNTWWYRFTNIIEDESINN